jgi:hypothetical protein
MTHLVWHLFDASLRARDNGALSLKGSNVRIASFDVI